MCLLICLQLSYNFADYLFCPFWALNLTDNPDHFIGIGRLIPTTLYVPVNEYLFRSIVGNQIILIVDEIN